MTPDEFRNRPREGEHARRQQSQLHGVGGSDTGVEPVSEDVVEQPRYGREMLEEGTTQVGEGQTRCLGLPDEDEIILEVVEGYA